MIDPVLILQFWAALIGIVSPISSSFQKLYAAWISLLSSIASFFQQRNPPSFFTHKHFFVIFGFLQAVSPEMARSTIQSNPGLYYVAATTLLIYLIASAIEASSNTNSLGWCVFFAKSISFAATASFLFQTSVRLVIFVLILIIISTCALLHWVHESQPLCINIWMRLAHRFLQQQRRATLSV